MGWENVSQQDDKTELALLTEMTVRAHANDNTLRRAMVGKTFHHTLHYVLYFCHTISMGEWVVSRIQGIFRRPRKDVRKYWYVLYSDLYWKHIWILSIANLSMFSLLRVFRQGRISTESDGGWIYSHGWDLQTRPRIYFEKSMKMVGPSEIVRIVLRFESPQYLPTTLVHTDNTRLNNAFHSFNPSFSLRGSFDSAKLYSFTFAISHSKRRWGQPIFPAR
jgi:hypothetical protein